MVFNMNIIFLDIDGVLRTHESDLAWSKELNESVRRGTNRLFVVIDDQVKDIVSI